MTNHTPWIPELHNIYQIKNPGYAADKEFDYEPIRYIAEFIAKQQNFSISEPLSDESRAKLVKAFKKFSMTVVKNNFWRRKSLSHIQKFLLQEIYGAMQNQDENEVIDKRKYL